MTVLDDLRRIPAPVLPDVPAQVLLDAARAYVDANAAHNRIKTSDELQAAAARAVVTSQLLQAAVATAYAAGQASVPMRYGVRNPISGGPVYSHADMSRAGVLRMAAADPTFHEAVCRRQSDWEPMRAEASHA